MDKPYALKAFHENHDLPSAENAILGDLRELDLKIFSDLLDVSGIAKLGCLIGEPPCQGFSQLRRSESKLGSGLLKFSGYNKLDEDPRNELVLRFLEVVNHLKPRTLVIENVPQFLNHYHNGKKGGLADRVEFLLEEMGYHVTCYTVTCSDFGVPQLRRRAILIGSMYGRIELESSKIKKRTSPPTVRDAIEDLPRLLGGKGNSKKIRGSKLSDYQKLMKNSGGKSPNGHTDRAYSGNYSGP